MTAPMTSRSFPEMTPCPERREGLLAWRRTAGRRDIGLRGVSPHGGGDLEHPDFSAQRLLDPGIPTLHGAAWALAILADVRARSDGRHGRSGIGGHRRQGNVHVYEFPRVADLPWWKKLPRFRRPKFTCSRMVDEFATPREFTGRYVLRQLGLPLKPIPFI